MQTMRKVAVIGGVRTPFCRGNTGYDDLTNLDLMTAALNGLVEKYGLAGEHIDEVVGGAVLTHAKDFNLTREAVIGTKLKRGHAGHHALAGLRHEPSGRARQRRQDRHRPDRGGHRLRLRHGLRSAHRAEAAIRQKAGAGQRGKGHDQEGRRLLSAASRWATSL